MTTLSALADRAQAALGDTAESSWSQTQVEEWVIEAIRDYSLFFPRLRSAELDCTAGQRSYELPADCLEVMQVEYPHGASPPDYLLRRSRLRLDFTDVEGYFDVENHYEAVEPSILWLSTGPAVGESIRVVYQAPHELNLQSEDDLTVPFQHEGLLLAYIAWQAWAQLASREMQSPTSAGSLLVSELNANARQARQDYEARLKAAAHAGLKLSIAGRMPNEPT